MVRICASIVQFCRDQNGATAIEYTFVAAIVSLSVIAGATQIGQSVKGFLQSVASGFH